MFGLDFYLNEDPWTLRGRERNVVHEAGDVSAETGTKMNKDRGEEEEMQTP